MTIALLIALIGLIVWFIFAKTPAADPWLAEVGRISFGVGLLGWIMTLGAKAAF